MYKIQNLRSLGVFLCCMVAVSVSAQRGRGVARAYLKTASGVVSKYTQAITQCADSAMAEQGDSVETTLSPYLYKLIGPGIYYRSVLSDKFDLKGAMTERMDTVDTDFFDYRQRLNASIDDVLFRTYVTQPSLFHYYDSQIESENIISPVSVVGAKKEDLASIYDKVEEIKDVVDVVDNIDVEIQIQKPNFWTTNGRSSLQFTQNYFSENWYRGGDNNMVLLSNIVLEANYNDQRCIAWDNKLDLRLGFITTTSDSIHRYIPNNDKIYFSSKLGVKAAKSWFYALSVQGNTQFLPGRRSNDRNTYSKFLAPLDVSASIGMDFKPSLKNGNSFSLALLPLSYKMRYICDDERTIHASYNMIGKDFQQDFGSRIEFVAKMTLVKNLQWKSRFYYFTSYEYAESELENSLLFQFNKYISSEVYTLWRFDDNRSKQYYDNSLGYFQFKEYFTLGLAYNF